MRRSRSTHATGLRLALALTLAGCGSERDDRTPEGAVALMVEALQRGGDPGRQAIYGLLDAESRRRLSTRARSATALGARDLEPWEMIVDDRATLRVVPRPGGLRVRPGATEDEAIVVVTSEQGQTAEVPVRREDGRWRIVLDVPPLPARGASSE